MSLLSFFGLSAATDRDPTSGFWYGPVGARTLAGVDVTEATMLNYSAAWACTRLLCATGSSTPLNILRMTGKQQREIALEHSAQRVLHHEFNPETGATMGRAFGINMQVNWGNFYAEIVRTMGTRGPVKELWPIHSSRVQMARYDDGVLGYRVKNEDGSTDDFRREEIFHVPNLISSNGIQGKGVIQNARESIGAAIGTERHGASFFGNGAMPGIIIKGGKFKDKAEREDYRRQWMEVHGGPDKALKPALLPPDADVAFMTFNARDSQFLELREHNINEMARWYGVPPHKVYDLRRGTFSNIEHQAIEYVVDSMIPLWRMWEEEIWRKLLTPEEQKTHFAKHSVEGLLRGDSAARAAFYKSLFEIGVLSINDILELEDRNGIGPDGDKRFVPLNMTTIEKAGIEVEQVPGDEGASVTEELQQRMNAYGIGVRAGAITPQTDDEDAFRKEAGLPLMSEDAKKAWKDDEGVRRPITLRDPNAPPSPFGQSRQSPEDEDGKGEAMARLIEFVTLPPVEVRQTNTALVDRAREVLSETVGRMLAKECRACEAAAKNNRNPKDFFAWLDEYYDRYGETLAGAICKQVGVLLLASDDLRNHEAVASAAAVHHVSRSKEDILQATEVCPSEWASVPERIAACGQRWQTERTTIFLGA